MGVYSIELPDKRVLDIEAADQNTAIRGAQEWHAANPQPELSAPQTVADVGESGVRGFNRGLARLVTAPYRGIDWLGEKITGGDFLPNAEDMPLYRQFLQQPAPRSRAGRYASAIGEAAGGAVIPSSMAMQAAGKLPVVAPAAPGLMDSVLRPIATNPGTATVIDAVATAGAGGGQEAAREAGAGETGQAIASLAGGIAAPFAAIPMAIASRRGVEAAGRMAVDRLGIRASADEGLPNVPPGARDPAYQVLADTLTRAGVSTPELRAALDQIGEARTFWSSGHAQDATALADLDESLMRLAGSLARQSPEAARIIRQFIQARQTGHTPAGIEAIDMADRGLPTRAPYTDPITGAQAQRRLGRSFDTAADQEVPSGLVDRTVDALRRAFLIKDADYHGHALTGRRTEQQIIERRRAAADINYDNAYTAGTGVNLRPAIAPVFETYLKAAAANESPKLENIIRSVRTMFRDGPIELKQFDRIKREFDDRIKSFLNRTDKSGVHIGGVLSDMQRSLLAAVDNVTVGGIPAPKAGTVRLYRGGDSKFLTSNIDEAARLGTVHYVDVPNTKRSMQRFAEGSTPGTFTTKSQKIMDSLRPAGVGPAYRAAREEFSTDARMIEAYRRGLKGLDDDAAVTADDFLSLTIPGEQKLFLFGLLDSARLRGDRMPRGHDFTKVFKTPRVEQILTAVIPRSQGKHDKFNDRPERFGRYVDSQSRMIESRNVVQGGSSTMRNAADDQALETLNAIALKQANSLIENLRGSQSMWQFGQRAFEMMIDKAFGLRADVAQALAHMLFTADPVQRGIILTNVSQRMGPNRMARFNELMQAHNLSIQSARSGGAASLGATTDSQSNSGP